MKTILVADDEPNIRLLVRLTFEAQRTRVLEASTGREALELALKEPLDLVLLDWTMPDGFGLDVLKALRSNSVFANLPVIMLTGRSQEGGRELAEASGVNEYVTKPFSPLGLLAMVDRFLGTGHGGETKLP